MNKSISGFMIPQLDYINQSLNLPTIVSSILNSSQVNPLDYFANRFTTGNILNTVGTYSLSQLPSGISQILSSYSSQAILNTQMNVS